MMQRNAQFITAERLHRAKRNAVCCDCEREVEEAAEYRPQEVWTIWRGEWFYCPKCANEEGIGYYQ